MQTALSLRALSDPTTAVSDLATAEGTAQARNRIAAESSQARSVSRLRNASPAINSTPHTSTSGGSSSIRLRFDGAHRARGRSTCQVEPAIYGNHLAIQNFLQRTLHRPTRVEFNSALARPDYDPSERLITKNPEDKTITGHIQIESQLIRFGRSEIPVARIRDFAMLPENRHQGFDELLLASAEAQAKRNGAMLLIARGEDYRFLRRNGWSMLGSDPTSVVSPQRLLGQLPAAAKPESPFYADKMPQTEVRIGRLTDVEVLSRIYDTAYDRNYGAMLRSPEKWSWLISKRAHNRIYVFSENGQPLAYVVVRGANVLELADLTDDARGSARLLERVGADAIDQGRYSLRLHCPLTSRVHAWADQAGGQLFADSTENGWMVKILSKRTLLRRLAHEMYRRKPKSLTELGIRIGNDELLIRNGVRSMKVTRGTSSKHHIGLTNRAAVQLFMGYRTVSELAEQQELVASDEIAIRAAEELFPAVMWWRTQWDDMPVLG